MPCKNSRNDRNPWRSPRHFSSDKKYVTVASGRGDPAKDIMVNVFKADLGESRGGERTPDQWINF